MINTAIRHSVTDYAKWKSVYDTFLHTTAGAKYARVNRSVEDPNLVTVVAGFDTLELAQAFLDNPNLKTAAYKSHTPNPDRIHTRMQLTRRRSVAGSDDPAPNQTVVSLPPGFVDSR